MLAKDEVGQIGPDPSPADHDTTPPMKNPTSLSFAPLPTLSVSSSSTPRGLTLIFHPDHPCSTHIRDGATGELLYVVESQVIRQPSSKKRTVTTIRRPSTETMIAQFEWGDFFTPNTVTLTRDIAGGLVENCNDGSKSLGRGAEDLIKMSAGSWLKKSSVPFKDTVTYRDPERKSYKWKGFAPGLSLELHSADEPSGPIAKFYKTRGPNARATGAKSRLRSKASSARLIVDRTLIYDGVVDEVLVAFLYLEKIRRERDDDGFRVIMNQYPPESSTSNS